MTKENKAEQVVKMKISKKAHAKLKKVSIEQARTFEAQVRVVLDQWTDQQK